MTENIGKKKKILYFSIVAVAVIALFVYEIFLAGWCKSEAISESVDMVITRFVGAGVVIFLLYLLGYRVLNKPSDKGLIFTLPCFVVAICNPPILSLLFGSSSLTYSGNTLFIYSVIFAVECVLVALFEELLFRGCVFLSILETRRKNNKQIFLSVLFSSAIFGLVHLLNLFSSSPVAVLLQVGYSFLLGGMSAYVLLCTGNLTFSVLLHAIFNFCGQYTELFGVGDWAIPPIIIFIILLGVIVAAIVITGLFKMPLCKADVFFTQKIAKKGETEGENDIKGVEKDGK